MKINLLEGEKEKPRRKIRIFHEQWWIVMV
jgi:hypothetical protein